jgi:hypothetical protein
MNNQGSYWVFCSCNGQGLLCPMCSGAGGWFDDRPPIITEYERELISIARQRATLYNTDVSKVISKEKQNDDNQ